MRQEAAIDLMHGQPVMTFVRYAGAHRGYPGSLVPPAPRRHRSGGGPSGYVVRSAKPHGRVLADAAPP